MLLFVLKILNLLYTEVKIFDKKPGKQSSIS